MNLICTHVYTLFLGWLVVVHSLLILGVQEEKNTKKKEKNSKKEAKNKKRTGIRDAPASVTSQKTQDSSHSQGEMRPVRPQEGRELLLRRGVGYDWSREEGSVDSC